MARSTVDMKWTVVQHSGFGYAHDRQFEHAVESRNVATKKEQEMVLKVGGLLFDTYGQAEDFCEEANYPADHVGLIPDVQGTFADKDVDGLKVYIPVRLAVG